MKKVITVVLALVLALSLCAAPVFAAENSMANFTKANTYNNNFTDINGHWATSVIQACYEYGLMNGTSAATFKPTGDLTVAQAIVMAARVHQTYAEGACTLSNGPGAEWYAPYVEYALANGLVKDGEFANVNDKITRAAMAAIFSRALPAAELMPINTFSYLPDVDAETKYAREITMLYQAGVLTGNNAYGTFKPTATITRAEAAAIIARVAVPAERKTFRLLDEYTYNNMSFAMLQNGKLEDGFISSGIVDASVVSNANEAFKTITVKDLTLEMWTETFCTALSENGLTYEDLDIAYASCGDVPVVKMTTHFTLHMEGQSFPFSYGTIAYIDQNVGEMVTLLYMVNEEGYDVLNALMKEFKINGKKIS